MFLYSAEKAQYPILVWVSHLCSIFSHECLVHPSMQRKNLTVV